VDGSRSQAIVVGVDESSSARDAAEWAADVAAAWGAPLHLVHVALGAPQDPPITLHPTWLTELCDAAVRAGADPNGTEVIPGNTIDLLAHRAAGALMLVLGSYGTGAWSGMLAGSVALGLIERASCPVVVVRGHAPQVPPRRDGPIVVGVDGTGAGQAALEFAADLADGLGARLAAVHTWTDVAVDREGAMHRTSADEAEQTKQAVDRLDAALAPITAAHPQLALEREVVGDTPLRALLDRAGEARLVVVGHRRERPASGMAMGSTSQALVEFAPCPVAVTKPISSGWSPQTAAAGHHTTALPMKRETP
jgi:nucleotide-binding universal stress UspA family protein